MIQSRPVKARGRLVGAHARGYHRVAVPVREDDIPPERRRRITHRALPTLGGLAAVSLRGRRVRRRAARRAAGERAAPDFAAAWERGDMRGDARAARPVARRQRYPLERFCAPTSRAATPRRSRSIDAGDPEARGGRGDGAGGARHARVRQPARRPRACRSRTTASTGSRGSCSRSCARASSSGDERAARRAPRSTRATGKVLAEGPRRRAPPRSWGSPTRSPGRMEPEETADERAALFARGFPRDWPVGQSGLEEVFEERLRGRPGGELIAGNRVLARARPRAGGDARPRSTRASRRRP